ncbi:MAG: hypothetical protein PHQ75_02400 [Thermoguttaceae bacterium]|nr:hypothetical protein [Thermoguttaceae bacterium]
MNGYLKFLIMMNMVIRAIVVTIIFPVSPNAIHLEQKLFRDILIFMVTCVNEKKETLKQFE